MNLYTVISLDTLAEYLSHRKFKGMEAYFPNLPAVVGLFILHFY